ncbi:hypothetical protein HYT23_02530 [Candidatus Pacearchaeota archaeon]|nr:hypothetical protein [Candidatus Pacearchaeota archaeon]
MVFIENITKNQESKKKKTSLSKLERDEIDELVKEVFGQDVKTVPVYASLIFGSGDNTFDISPIDHLQIKTINDGLIARLYPFNHNMVLYNKIDIDNARLFGEKYEENYILYGNFVIRTDYS